MYRDNFNPSIVDTTGRVRGQAQELAPRLLAHLLPGPPMSSNYGTQALLNDQAIAKREGGFGLQSARLSVGKGKIITLAHIAGALAKMLPKHYR